MKIYYLIVIGFLTVFSSQSSFASDNKNTQQNSTLEVQPGANSLFKNYLSNFGFNFFNKEDYSKIIGSLTAVQLEDSKSHAQAIEDKIKSLGDYINTIYRGNVDRSIVGVVTRWKSYKKVNFQEFCLYANVAQNFLTNKMNRPAVWQILRNVGKLPNDNYFDKRIKAIQEFSLENIGKYEGRAKSLIADIFDTIIKLPTDGSLDRCIERTRFLSEGMDHYQIVEIFFNVINLPNDEHLDKRIEGIKKLFNLKVNRDEIKRTFDFVTYFPNDKDFDKCIDIIQLFLPPEDINTYKTIDILSRLSEEHLSNLLEHKNLPKLSNMDFQDIDNFFVYFNDYAPVGNILKIWSEQMESLQEQIKNKQITDDLKIRLFPLVAAGADLPKIYNSMCGKRKNIYTDILFSFLFSSFDSFQKVSRSKNYSQKKFLNLIQKTEGLELFLSEKLDSLNVSLVRLYGEFLESRVPEESPLGQHVIRSFIRVADKNDTRSPYAIYKKLEEKRDEIIEYQSLNMPIAKLYLENMWGQNFRIDPLFASKNFKKLALTQEKLPQEFNTFLPFFESFFENETNLSKFIIAKNLNKNLESEFSALNICRRFLRIDEKKEGIDLETFYMASIMNHVSSLSKESDEKHHHKFSPQEEFLARLMMQMQNCPKGMKGGIEDIYYQLPLKQQLIGHKAENDLINVLHQCKKEYLSDGNNLFYKTICGLSKDVDPQQAIHQAIYVQTVLSEEFNLNVPDFDINCPQVYITLLMASKKSILETFYRYFTPEEAVNRFTVKVNELLKKPQDNIFLECKRIFGTSDVQEWMDEDGLFTDRGAAKMLVNMKFFKEVKDEIIEN